MIFQKELNAAKGLRAETGIMGSQANLTNQAAPPPVVGKAPNYHFILEATLGEIAAMGETLENMTAKLMPVLCVEPNQAVHQPQESIGTTPSTWNVSTELDARLAKLLNEMAMLKTRLENLNRVISL
jgi:hypothetical protein